jgi:ribulose-phosphate 3-epimerase
MEIIPTLVPASFDEIRTAAARYPFAPVLHIDAGDGSFVPNTTWQPAEGDQLPTSHIWEAHLMVSDPVAGALFAKAGASRIIAHLEAFADRGAIPAAFDAWKAAGAREVGLALKLDTALDPASIPPCDVIHLMTIARIGTQGAPFEASSLDRIALIRSQFPQAVIAVDGGINETNIAEVARAGANRFCVGAALASSPEPEAVYKRLVEAAGAIQ